MQSPSAYLESLRPAGSKRSGKRDLIVNVFLRQEGHLSADDLVDLIRREDERISRATVYRTLQWMVEAGIARKVDFGEGRFRFEHSYRHPRHFHLLCKQCNRSFEFLSSDIEALIEEVATARGFAARQSVLQVYGTCERLPHGPARLGSRGRQRSSCSPATRCVSRSRPSAAASSSTRRAARHRRVTPGAAPCSSGWRRRSASTWRSSRCATGNCSRRIAELEARPTFLFFKGAANGLFAAGAAELLAGVDARKALLIGIRCERGSHRFFKRYGERFEDSEGKRIFLEFADEEREHLDLLIREYRALGEPLRAPAPAHRPVVVAAAPPCARSRVIDLHLHTTASDGPTIPATLLGTCAGPASGLQRHRPRHRGRPGAMRGAGRSALGLEFVGGIEITAVLDAEDVHVLGLRVRRGLRRGSPSSCAPSGPTASRGPRRWAIAWPTSARRSTSARCCRAPPGTGRDRLAARRLPTRWSAPAMPPRDSDAFEQFLGRDRPAYVARRGPRPPARWCSMIVEAGGLASIAHPGLLRHPGFLRQLPAAGLAALEVYHPDHSPAMRASSPRMARRLGLCVTGGSDFHGEAAGRARPLGRVCLPRTHYERMLAEGRRRGCVEAAAPARPRLTRGPFPPPARLSLEPMATAAPPVIEITGLVKDYKGLRPLRLASLTVQDGERVSVGGIDATAAEVLVNLVNGAILPDQGAVCVFGQDTVDIGNETDWLASLERFGLVSPRAVLLDGATLLQNLALPITLDIEALADDVRAQVEALAHRVGIDHDWLERLAGDAPADVRMRVHLARAIVLNPQVLILEHPTLGVPPDVVPAFAQDVLRVVAPERLTVLAVTNDDVFSGVVAQRAYHLHAATGQLVSARGWRRWLGV